MTIEDRILEFHDEMFLYRIAQVLRLNGENIALTMLTEYPFENGVLRELTLKAAKEARFDITQGANAIGDDSDLLSPFLVWRFMRAGMHEDALAIAERVEGVKIGLASYSDHQLPDDGRARLAREGLIELSKDKIDASMAQKLAVRGHDVLVELDLAQPVSIKDLRALYFPGFEANLLSSTEALNEIARAGWAVIALQEMAQGIPNQTWLNVLANLAKSMRLDAENAGGEFSEN
jgi:hypothetical protein